MKIKSIVAGLIVMTVFAGMPSMGLAQVSSVANAVVPTEYAGANQDSIHVFCGLRDQNNGSLTATSPTAESSTFEWLKYNVTTGSFDAFQSDQSGNTTSTISNLQNGAYRVNIAGTSGVTTYTTWVINNYIETTAEITDSDCNSLTLSGTPDSPVLTYVDLTNGQEKILNKGIQVRWTAGEESVSTVLNPQVFDPPTTDTDYTLTVSDRFGCTSQAVVKYISIVTKASFTHVEEEHPMGIQGKKEAPLTVTFTNTSENGDAGKYEWFIFKDLNEIKLESQANPTAVIDSIMEKIYTDSPTYTFEKTGIYNVKLVSQKKSEFTTCYDTVYIESPIIIEESFVDAPNFFTPNQDGTNDKFLVAFFSMQTAKISIFNRWGKVVHVWESKNVRGFGPTQESDPQSVWDGEIGGKLATPGVYYYVVDGIGRDDERRKTGGFVHLFRDK